MIALIRYCRGYVRISVRGYAPERFMNLCANRAIVLWELNGHDGFYTMCISLSDFFKIRDIVHKTKTRVAVLEKRGLPFFLQDVRHRKMFLLGVFLCSAFLILMSQFIWAMEFDGNRMITEDELKRYLEDEGNPLRHAAALFLRKLSKRTSGKPLKKSPGRLSASGTSLL